MKKIPSDLDEIRIIREYALQLRDGLEKDKEARKRVWRAKVDGWEKGGYRIPSVRKVLEEYSIQGDPQKV